jgi:hypothetical protein
VFGILNFGHCDLPFDLAQGGGESFDSAQDREPVERLVEPFGIWYLLFGIFLIADTRHLQSFTTCCQIKPDKGLMHKKKGI